MTIDNCPRLIRLQTPASWEYTMPKLEELRVTNCPVMKELLQFAYESAGPRILLPSLKILELYGLHNLSQGVLQLSQCLPNLKDLKIHDCGVKCVLSFSFSREIEALPDPLPTLAKLHIENCPEMIEIIFVTDAPNAPNASLQAQCCFQGLMHLTIESYRRLSHLFSYKQAISMQHLSRLYIRHYAALGTVVISKENEEEASASTSTSATTTTSASTSTHVVHHESYNSLFPNLRQLTLYDLPQLTAFHCPAALPIDWLFLQHCCIEKCPNLQDPLLGTHTPPQNQLGFSREQRL
ncbi:RNI-like protein [Dioscorea alata]|uniref:RNI-like protein n=1 Tax=Dioscorea alata TaxID=55571 RepID=A0ACB7UNS5_DIOAL|nr:RNI-like protein [Dioscorea alata]